MDLEALGEFLFQLSGEDGFERGRTYTAEITEEEGKKFFGELPPQGATLTVKLHVEGNSNSPHLSLVRKLQCLPGGKDKPQER
jgi:hypothetical protein